MEPKEHECGKRAWELPVLVEAAVVRSTLSGFAGTGDTLGGGSSITPTGS